MTGAVPPSRPRTTALFLGLIAFHVAHVFEEVWAGFWIMEKVFGPGWFMAVNWLLLLVPLAFFYFYLQGRRWALLCGLLYGGVMVLNGAGHIAAVAVTGRYFHFAPGGATGVGLIVLGIFLIQSLRGERRAARSAAAGNSCDEGPLSI